MKDDRAVLVSKEEIEKRRQMGAWIRGSHAVDNLHANPDTQYIFKDFEEGRIATADEVKQLLHEHYSEISKNENGHN